MAAENLYRIAALGVSSILLAGFGHVLPFVPEGGGVSETAGKTGV
jgi:hypothetical protein